MERSTAIAIRRQIGRAELQWRERNNSQLDIEHRHLTRNIYLNSDDDATDGMAIPERKNGPAFQPQTRTP